MVAEVATLDRTQKCWMVKASVLPRTAWARGAARAKKGCRQLENRYGPRYTSAMLGAAFIGLFLPIPGSSLLCVAVVVSVAEVHRAISRSSTEPRRAGASPAWPDCLRRRV